MNDEQQPGAATAAGGEDPRAKRLWVLKVALLTAIVAILGPFVVPTVGRIAAGLQYPYQMDSEEGFVLWQAWQLRHGQNIFRPLDSPPYVAATYGPLYPLICAATLWGKVPAFFGGRAIVALSVIAICIFMALIIWSETRQPLAVLLGPLLFLNSYDVYQWLPFYRVDFPALALGMAGLWLLTRPRTAAKEDGLEGDRLEAYSTKWLWRAACACFVAMVYTRQVELAPFVTALFYFWIVDRSRAWRLLRNVGGWGLGIAAVLTLLTRGQFLVHNIYYNANPFSLWQLKTVLVGSYRDDGRFIGGHFSNLNRFFAVAVVVCLIWYVVERLRRSGTGNGRISCQPVPHRPDAHATDGSTGFQSANEHRQDGCSTDEWGHLDLFALYAVIASFGVLGLGKIGAAMNYLIEPKAAWSLFVALVLGKTIRPLPTTGHVLGYRPVFVPVAFVLALHAMEFLCSSTFVPIVQYWLRRNPESAMARFIGQPGVRNYLASRPQVLFAGGTANPTAADFVNGDRIVEMLRRTDGPVLCEHAILAMRAGKPVYSQPFIMKELAIEGKWDQTPVVAALRQKQFALLVTTEDITKEGFFFHYTNEMVAAMREAYRLRETLDGGPAALSVFTYYIFEPR